ncbi:MAG: ATP-binding protein [Treponema sp.]|nr:ATP-binding protein [Treponema sp.]
MVTRTEYLTELERHRGKSDLIKVVTGVRRCGKTTLLQQFQKKLSKKNIPASRIIDISLEGIENEELRDGKTLYKFIKSKLKSGDLYYVFIDEIQITSDYEEIANSLRLLKNVDLYVTGSNSNLLTGKFATRWAGRYVKIKMLPLSFKEYAGIFPGLNLDIIYRNYIEQSSFPEIIKYHEIPKRDGSLKRNVNLSRNGVIWDESGVRTYLDAIYNSILIKDVMLQQGIKDASLLERVVKCLFSNIGSETSINNMVNMLNNDLKLRSTEKNIYAATLEDYIEGLQKSFVFYKAERKFIKGREYLKTNAKYYAVDVGLRYFLLGNKDADSGHILENIVYLELLRRGNKVYFGKVAEKEVDFIADGPKGIEYYQVAETVRGRQTLNRELDSLNAINDNFPKFLLTRDYEPKITHNGVKQLNVLEWLLGEVE